MVAYSALAFSLLGSGLLAQSNKYSRYGWILFLIANALWSIVAIDSGQIALLIQNLAFTLTSGYGLYTGFFKCGKK